MRIEVYHNNIQNGYNFESLQKILFKLRRLVIKFIKNVYLP